MDASHGIAEQRAWSCHSDSDAHAFQKKSTRRKNDATSAAIRARICEDGIISPFFNKRCFASLDGNMPQIGETFRSAQLFLRMANVSVLHPERTCRLRATRRSIRNQALHTKLQR